MAQPPMSLSGGVVTGLPSQPPSIGTMSNPSGMLGEREVVRNTGKQAILSFLDTQNCYSVLRASGKVVVFDTRIPIQLAFYALVEHGEFELDVFWLMFVLCWVLCWIYPRDQY